MDECLCFSDGRSSEMRVAPRFDKLEVEVNNGVDVAEQSSTFFLTADQERQLLQYLQARATRC